MKRSLAFFSLFIFVFAPDLARANNHNAVEALASTMVDLYEKPEQRTAVMKEFEEQTKGIEFKFYIPEGPPPVPTD